ncbi:RING/U-box superfamily protein [Striga asiatica]|uniref:RING/U-box superfamily protein n=1 Tax=Striga asiatica TaxID=4170 RepID=A0A5A7PHF5_STRAF|nr:RING/U-box superfamily protein [Striga asiatica]
MESKEVHSTSKSSDDQTQSGPIEGDCSITREVAVELSPSEMTGGGPIEGDCSITREAVTVEISPSAVTERAYAEPAPRWNSIPQGEILVVNFITKNKGERQLGTVPKMEAICSICFRFFEKYAIAFKTKCNCEMNLVHEKCGSKFSEEKENCSLCDIEIGQCMPVVLSPEGEEDPLAILETNPLGPIEGDCSITQEAAVELSPSAVTVPAFAEPAPRWNSIPQGEVLVVNFITKNKGERQLDTVPKMEAICSMCYRFFEKYAIAFKTKCNCEMNLVHEKCGSKFSEEKENCSLCDTEIGQCMPVVLSP